MNVKVGWYKFLLIASIVFNIVFLVISMVVVTLRYPEWIYDYFIWTFYAPFFVFLIQSLYVFFFIRSKYPYNYITNKNEGFIYVFAILGFLASLFSFFPSYLILQNFFTYTQRGNSAAYIFLVASISTAIAAILSIIIGIFSFKFLKIIRKNRLTLAQQIKSLGVDSDAESK